MWRVGLWWCLAGALEGGGDCTANSVAIAGCVVDHSDGVSQSYGLETRGDDIKCSAFLADEQNALLLGDGGGDEVGDELGFAGTGWTLDYEASALLACQEGEDSILAGV